MILKAHVSFWQEHLEIFLICIDFFFKKFIQGLQIELTIINEDPASLALEYRSLICENIEFDNLLLTFPERTELLEGIVELILDAFVQVERDPDLQHTLSGRDCEKQVPEAQLLPYRLCGELLCGKYDQSQEHPEIPACVSVQCTNDHRWILHC